MARDKPTDEGKNEKVDKAVYRKGDKYYCYECNSVIEMHGDCPYCHKHIDWDKIKVQIKQD
jgi:hypothetical protein